MPIKPTQIRQVQGVYAPGPEHWVGDGFHVRTVFWPDRGAKALSPFLLLDHGATRHFDPTDIPRGVDEHPHRGFETVTFAFEGEVDHKDSAGGGGRIGPGDVQWMTAGSGVVHEEKHSRAFTETGGDFSMIQLWVNLPSKLKMTPPRYQALTDDLFPRIDLGVATARIIAGSLSEVQGPAKTHSPITVLDVMFTEKGEISIPLPAQWTTIAFCFEGEGWAGEDKQTIASRHFAIFSPEQGDTVMIGGHPGSRILLLAGQPLDEPVVAYGPFVMNTSEEIRQAMVDYQRGAIGQIVRQ